MRPLQEKLEKMQRRLKTFSHFLDDSSEPIPHLSYAHELGEDWQSIQKYLNEITVAFEFECYLNTMNGTLQDYRNESLDLIDMKEIRSDFLFYLKKYFLRQNNSYGWAKLEDAYRNAIESIIVQRLERIEAALSSTEREHFYAETREKTLAELETTVQKEITLNVWLNDSFSTLFKVIARFNFDEPNYGFWSENNTFLHASEDSQFSEYDEDIDDRKTHREICYNTIKERIEEVFEGAKVAVSPEWHGIATTYKIENPSMWFVEYDSSLTQYNDTYQKVPVEIISPRIPAKNFIKVLSIFKKRIYDYFDGETGSNKKIGCHVNITFPDHLKLDAVKLIIMADADRWATRFNRQFCEYAISQQDGFRAAIANYRGKTFNIQQLIQRFGSMIKHQKMMDINFLKTNMIEFRFPGNEYLDKYYQDLIETVQWLLYAMVVATHENFHRQEYLYRISKMISQTKKLKEIQNNLLNLTYAYVKSIINSYSVMMDVVDFSKRLDYFSESYIKLNLRKIKMELDKKEETIKARQMTSNIELKELIAEFHLGSSADDNYSKSLFLKKIKSLEERSELDVRTAINFENNRGAMEAFRTYRKCQMVFSILKLPLIAA